MSTHIERVQAEDLMSVGSRISWGAILGGAFVALALYFMLSVLGAAVGLTLSPRMETSTLQQSAILWNILVLSISLFVGGIMSSLFTAGENKVEAVFFGVIMWGFVIGVLMHIAASGAHAAGNGLIGLMNATPNANAPAVDAAARDAAAATDRATREPQTREEIREAAKKTAWWVFGGTWFSMIAAGVGGWMGAGPTFESSRW